MQSMMDIVIPLRVVALNLAVLRSLQVARLVVIVFKDEMDVAIRLNRTSHRIVYFREDVRLGVINNGVNCIESKSVEVIFGQPVHGVMNEEVADGSAVKSIEIDGVPPGSLVSISKELRRVGIEIIFFGAEVVVDHVEENHQPAIVRALNQRF